MDCKTLIEEQNAKDHIVLDVDEVPIMSFRHISKFFGGVQALSDVNVDLYRGKVIALVGDNGAGKSTFLKVISGVYSPEIGELLYNGEPISIENPFDAICRGIQTIYQDLALCDNLDIVQNLFLGRELTDKAGRLENSKMEWMAKKCLQELGIEIDNIRSKVGTLSGGQRQIVAIARAMLGDPDIVLMDEPLANLGVRQRQQVVKLIKVLRKKHICVVMVSHDLAETLKICDHVIVFRLGEKVAEFKKEEITKENVIAEITGSKLKCLRKQGEE